MRSVSCTSGPYQLPCDIDKDQKAQALPGLQVHGSCIGAGCLVKSLQNITAL